MTKIEALSSSEVADACTRAGSPFFSPDTTRFFDTVRDSTAWRGGLRIYLALDNKAAPTGCRFCVAEVELARYLDIGSGVVRTYSGGGALYYADTMEAARATARTLARAAEEVARG